MPAPFSRSLNGYRLPMAGLFALSSLVTAFGLAWLLLYKTNFWYGYWHDTTGIATAIERFGPENRYRFGFASTSKTERERLFGRISYGVHHGGKGLDTITYEVALNGRHIKQFLLTADEVGHLNDVAHLVDRVRLGVWGGLVLLVGLVVFYARQRLPLPSILAQSLAVGGLILIGSLALLLIGPTAAFTKMHEWVFPPGHPWFFYYQDSLMSTMMWAPVLFGWIAIAWSALTLGFFVLVQVGARLLCRMTARSLR
jgi:hypothetical protein